MNKDNIFQMKGLLPNWYLLIFILLFGLTACRSENVEKEKPLTFKTLTASDSINVRLEDVGARKVIFNISIDFPDSYLNDNSLNSLNKIFYEKILNCKINGASKEKVLNAILNRSLDPYKSLPQTINNVSKTDLFNYSTRVKSVFYNKSILSISKTSSTEKNNEKSNNERRYYNINLKEMRILGLEDIFTEKSQNILNDKLRKELLSQNKVSTERELNTLGYYNLDNLYANNNFYFNDYGITWIFLPLEIGCINLGDTEISLSYKTLSSLMNEKIRKLL